MDAHFTKILSQPINGTKRNLNGKESFIASDKYVGFKVGYVFQMGKNGLGYYLDRYYTFERAGEEADLNQTDQKQADEVAYLFNIRYLQFMQTMVGFNCQKAQTGRSRRCIRGSERC